MIELRSQLRPYCPQCDGERPRWPALVFLASTAVVLGLAYLLPAYTLP